MSLDTHRRARQDNFFAASSRMHHVCLLAVSPSVKEPFHLHINRGVSPSAYCRCLARSSLQVCTLACRLTGQTWCLPDISCHRSLGSRTFTARTVLLWPVSCCCIYCGSALLVKIKEWLMLFNGLPVVLKGCENCCCNGNGRLWCSP